MANRHPDLNAYLDGELNARQRQTIEEHLRACEACRHTLREMEALRHLLRDVAAPMPRFTPEGFAAHISQRLPGRRSAKRSGPVLAPLALAFLVWSFITAIFRLINGLLALPPFARLMPNLSTLWWVNVLRPLGEIPVVQMMMRVLTLGGWLGWDDWAFVIFSFSWALLSAGLLALDWAWTRHQTRMA